MPRLKLIIAYDGRMWKGWQSQPGGKTIQDRIEAALTTINGTRIPLHGSGRTDAGVHAHAQVAHFDAPENAMTPEVWQRALNANLPVSIRIRSCEQAYDEFHARFDAKGKIYQYRIWRGDLMNPVEAGLAWHVHGPLNVQLIKEGAAVLCGTHNYSRLSANRGHISEEERRSDDLNVVRTVRSIEIVESPNLLLFELEGDGFLYKMVRLIVGSLVHAGRGRANIEWLQSLVQDPQGLKSNQCAPADGLYLTKVLY